MYENSILTILHQCAEGTQAWDVEVSLETVRLTYFDTPKMQVIN